MPHDRRDDDDPSLEIRLDHLEAEYSEKLWWYRVPGHSGTDANARAATSRDRDREEFARRNRERQAEQRVAEIEQRINQRQATLDADQAEVLAAL
ncbi:MAG: hypothetical protein HC828_04785 [Blastochloris sp.]|nr:hypothetical protein [Blastochloris sp.]